MRVKVWRKKNLIAKVLFDQTIELLRAVPCGRFLNNLEFVVYGVV